jgi:hypothetical protein
MNRQELLKEYIYWLRRKDDVFYAFDNPEEVAIEFLEQLKTEK